MKKLLFKIAALSVISSSISFTMTQEEPSEIFVVNNDTLYRPLQVTFNFKGKDVARDSNTGTALLLGKGNDIKKDAPVKISIRGTYLGKTANPLALTKSDLLKAWQLVRRSESDPLIITISSSILSPLTLTANYSNQLPVVYSKEMKKEQQKAIHNALAIFPRIVHYGLEKNITEDAVLNARSWKEVLYSGYLTETTAEDIYRYILGLQKPYTKKQVLEAYRLLSLEWHPDKATAEDKAPIAEKVFRLLTVAKDGLLEAIKDQPIDQTYEEELKKEKVEKKEGVAEEQIISEAFQKI
jgi:hypothetical protein